jgi:hypothetical protein
MYSWVWLHSLPEVLQMYVCQCYHSRGSCCIIQVLWSLLIFLLIWIFLLVPVVNHYYFGIFLFVQALVKHRLYPLKYLVHLAMKGEVGGH